ncbi:MAG: M48 family metallopeptidase [Kiritimatiellaeota bacterium]|nr:M48 family metallopeptidase [Kiritimatiellota bacterium]
MNFFDQQDHSRRATRKLVGLYGLAVLGTAVMFHAGIALVWSLLVSGQEGAGVDFGTAFVNALLNPDVALAVFVLIVVIIGGASLYKILALRAGGASVALAMGGRRVAPMTRDLRERRLLNVVEEMALAAGVSMPSVFVLDNERGMNAFAAGFASKDAAVAVTRGLLETLNRDELQAVIGHEFSHILNGDMRLNIRLIGVLHGIFALTILGVLFMRIAARIRGGKKNGGGIKLVLLVLGVVCWLVGQIGFFFGRLIQSSISRQREFLADASAVQFTRNPGGLADALKIIGVKSSGLDAPNVSAVSHMLFASGLSSMFATHPPLLARIRKIEPGFDGNFGDVRVMLKRRIEEAKAAPKSNDPSMDAEDERVVRNTMYGVHRALRYEETPTVGTTLTVAGAGASPVPTDLPWLSDEDRDMLHDPLSAECCVCGALLSTDKSIRDLQLDMLPYRFENDTDMTDACLAWQMRMTDWTVRQRRIACELAVATIRNASPDNLKHFCESIDKLCRADNVIEPFEFALTCMIRRRLQPDASLVHARQSTVPPKALASEIALVLSMIASFDAVSEQAALDAWTAGKQRVTPYTGELVMPEPGILRDFDAFDAALSRLERLPPLFKRAFMQACEDIIRHDSVVTDTEENLLFAVADAIDAIGWNATR